MLKYKVDKIEDVEEVYRPLYKKQTDGTWLLTEVEGVVPADRLAEFRDNNLELKRQLEAFEGVDPAKYQELVGLETRFKEGKLFEQGKVDEIVSERTKGMQTEYQKEIDKRDQQINAQNQRLSGLLIDSAVKSTAIALGALPTAVDDVVLRAKSVFQINKEGVPVSLDDKGNVRYGKNPEKPLSIDEWAKDLKAQAPHLFQGMSGSGGRGSGAPGPNGMDTSKMSPAQKISAGIAAGQGTGPQPTA